MTEPVQSPSPARADLERRVVLLAVRIAGLLLLLPSVALMAGLLSVLPAGSAPAGAATPATSSAGGWTAPVTPASGVPAVARAFRAPAQRWAPGHRGVDLAVVPSQHVLAPADGTVSFVGFVVDRGVMVIAHPGGLRTSLEPVSPLVSQGAVVARGQPVAVVAAEPAHCAPVACLHWGVRHGEVYLDPLLLLGRREPSVLLPLTAARSPGSPGPV